MIEIIQDSKEQAPLTFSTVKGVTVVVRSLPVGDYGATYNGIIDRVVVERKSIPDLFTSFAGGYDAEKSKIDRAKSMGIDLILAIEGTAFDVRAGHEYTKGGEVIRSKKDGISQIRQLMTMLRKRYFREIWWCRSRAEMAFLIQEFYLSLERA